MSIEIEAPPQVVFEHLTVAERMVAWMGQHAVLEPTPGGQVAVDINGYQFRGEYLELEPPKRVVVSWGIAGAADQPPGSSRVEFRLTPIPGGTRLTLRHTGLPEPPVSTHGAGWANHLPRLRVAARGRDPGPDMWMSAARLANDRSKQDETRGDDRADPRQEKRYMSDKPSVVLVHGAWADGSSWSAVIEALQAKGFSVTAPQFPLTSLANDVARLRQVLARQSGPTVVAGHSYGGHIMTALGADHPNVAALVYIAGFGLDQGESLGALLGGGPTPPVMAHLIVDEQGFGWLPREDVVGHFAADVDPVKANVIYAVQQGISMSILETVMGEPAWRSLPSWYLVAANDEAIPPDAERMFAKRMGATTVEVASSHVAMVSHPKDVVQLIEAAAEVVGGAGSQV